MINFENYTLLFKIVYSTFFKSNINIYIYIDSFFKVSVNSAQQA